MATNDLITRAKSVLAQTKAEGSKQYAGSKFDTTKPITTDQLQPIQPYNLNLPTPKVPSSGLESAITGSVNAYKTQGEQERAMREESQKTAKNDLSSSINEIMGLNTEIANVDNTIDRTAEDTARKEADRFTSEIEAEQLAVRRKIEALQKNPQGMTMGAIADESNRLERDSLSKQADLAILQNSALRNYTTAKDIADREVQNKLEPLKVKLENLKFFYQENKELFNKEDERLYNEKIKAEQRIVDREEKELSQISDLSIEAAKQQAPASVIKAIRSAKTIDEAYKAAGNYVIDYDTQLKKAQVAKAWKEAREVDVDTGVLSEKQLKYIDSSPQGKKLTSLSSLYQLSNTYKTLVDTYGFNATGANKTLLDNAYADLKIAYKEAANLGALTGPDVGIIEEAIKPASGAKNYLNYRLSGGKGGVSAGIDQALSKARKEALQNYKQLTNRDAGYQNSDYVRGLLTPFAKDYSTVDLDTIPAGDIIQTEDGVLLESLGDGNFSPL